MRTLPRFHPLFPRPAIRAALAGAAALLLFSGCFEKRVIWSPDGQRAVVLTKDGELRLCDANGQLTPVLAQSVHRAAWKDDGAQLILARHRTVRDWAEIAPALGEERAEELADVSENIWEQLRLGQGWAAAMAAVRGEEADAVALFLREKHAAELPDRLGESWDDLTRVEVELDELIAARVVGQNLELGAVFYAGFEATMELRPAPGRALVAFVTESARGGAGVLRVIAPKEKSAAILVAENTAAYPDWTDDGRALVFAQAAAKHSEDAESGFGAIVHREIQGEDASLQAAPEATELALIAFNAFTRVRCLRDGRVLFGALEFSLPLAARDGAEPPQQLFALDPKTREITPLIPGQKEGAIPPPLLYFEVSPDETHVVFGRPKGDVHMLTLATGKVQRIQAPHEDDAQGAPEWRRDHELTYFRRNPPKADGSKPARTAELVLRRGEEETVLSREWPGEVLQSVLE